MPKAKTIHCDVAYPIEVDPATGELPTEIMYFPVGKHKIHPMVNDKPSKDGIDLDIDASVLDCLQKDLETRLTQKVRPIADFDHRPGPASFLPKRFVWRDGAGVFLQGDWTSAGKSAIQGRDYSYFSPSFMLSGSKIVGLPQTGAIGALTNNPAFRDIQRIAAAEEGDTTEPTPQQGTTMSNPILTQAVSLGLITETADEVKAALQLVASHTALIKRAEAAETLVAASQAREQEALSVAATQAVETAITQGRLPGKNPAVKAAWVKAMLANPKDTAEMIGAMAPNPALSVVVPVKTGDAGRRVIQADGYSIQEQIELKLTAIRAANPNADLDTCYKLCEAANPELFRSASQEIEVEEVRA